MTERPINFRQGESEIVRVPKLNEMSTDLNSMSLLVTGIGGVTLDGGTAFGDGSDNYIIDGGSAGTTWL